MSELLFYDDVEIGNLWRSPARTIRRADVLQFAQLTGDDNPLHLDEDFASQTPFGRPIVHGLFGLSLVTGLSMGSPLMHTVILTRIVDWRFTRPIYVGDTVHVETQVVEKSPYGRRRGIITWQRRLINQDNDVVQEGTTETIVSLHAMAKVLPR